jgi:hypothetical protein
MGLSFNGPPNLSIDDAWWKCLLAKESMPSAYRRKAPQPCLVEAEVSLRRRSILAGSQGFS